MTSPCDLIAKQMGSLFDCSTTVNGYVRIRTPFLYPDGDIIDIYFRETDKGIVLGDLGSTLMWLNTQTPVERRTKRQMQTIREVCATHNVEFSQGAISVSVPDATRVAESVARIGQAASRIADLCFTLRTRSGSSTAEDVAEFLIEHKVPFRPNEKVKGYSNKEYSIDFFVYPPKRDSYVVLLSTGNPSIALELAEKTNGIWRDLDVLKSGTSKPVKFVTLFDDTQDVWKPEHERMVERDSEIAHWSDSSDFLRRLEAA